MRLGSALLALALALFGCLDESSSTQSTEPQPVSYRRQIQPIWDRWCIGCHNFHTPHLVAAESAEHLAGMSWFKCDGGTQRARFVVPSDPSRSYLLYKLTMDNTNNYDIEQCGRAMPADRGGVDTPLLELDPEAVTTIRTWIEEGAIFD